MNHKKNDYPSSSQQLTMFEREAPYPTPELVAKEAPPPRSVTAKPDTNANREGYKQTKLGWIPSAWSVRKLTDVVEKSQYGLSLSSTKDGQIPMFKMNNFVDGKLSPYGVNRVNLEENEIKNYRLEKGDLLFNRTNSQELVGKTGIFDLEGLYVFASYLVRFKIDSSSANPEFVNYFFNFSETQQKFKSIATIGVSQSNINPTNLKNWLRIPLPPLPEQRAIADCLGTWDQAIQTLTQLITQKELRKKWLMQQLLTGKKRLPGFGGEWREVHIRDFSKEVSAKNSNKKDIIVLSCTKYNGLVPSLEYFGRKIYSDNLHTYKIVPNNHFAYATNHIEEGSIGYQSKYEEGLISPMYTVFKTDASVNDELLYRILKSHNLIHEYNKRMEGSIDRRGGLRWKTFSGIKFSLPSIEEQTAIAQILQRADQEISLLNHKLTHLQDQKKGLMQQLLTGNKRLNLNNKQNGKK